MKIEIEAPDEFAGALMGDLSGRRGRVQGMESGGYRNDYSGRGADGGDADLWHDADFDDAGTRDSFRMEMDHYDIVPQAIAEKILAAAKQPVLTRRNDTAPNMLIEI